MQEALIQFAEQLDNDALYKERTVTYRDKEIMERWRRGEAISKIARVLQMTMDEVLTVTNKKVV
jgi:Mor family transcriptional regulator